MEKTTKTDVMDYLRWRGDLTFEQDPFNEVDNLVLCIISYINFRRFPGLRTRDPKLAVALPAVFRELTPEDEQLGLSLLPYIPVMEQAADCERFRDVKMFAYESRMDEKRDMQFNAVSFLLPDESVFVAYMGTDRSLAGWKEDFNMSYLSATPSQLRATEYAAEIAAACPERKLRIGGHSKGGNLAAWAGIHLPRELQEGCLVAVYNNDGPGFSRDILGTEEYRRVENKLHSFIPEESLVGVLLEHGEDYQVIASHYRGIAQHEARSWMTMGNHFVHLNARSQAGKAGDEVLRQWIGSMTPQEREEFSEAVFEVLSLNGQIHSLDELEKEGIAGRAALLKEFIGSDEGKRKIITMLLHRLAVDVGEEVKKSAEGGKKRAEQAVRKLNENIKKKKS